jgi:hypothetical protein
MDILYIVIGFAVFWFGAGYVTYRLLVRLIYRPLVFSFIQFRAASVNNDWKEGVSWARKIFVAFPKWYWHYTLRDYATTTSIESKDCVLYPHQIYRSYYRRPKENLNDQ